jgi:hypothetical protein
MWRHRVSVLTHQGLGVSEIEKELQAIADKEGRWDVPARSTVQRLRRRARASDEGERSQYAPFRWPESMADAGIPWEGSPVVLAVLRDDFLNQRTSQIGWMKWYWRVHLAAPDLPDSSKEIAAIQLWRHELFHSSATSTTKRAVETYLAYGLWRFQEYPWHQYDYTLNRLLNANALELPPWLRSTLEVPLEYPGLLMFLQVVWVETGVWPPAGGPIGWIEELRNAFDERGLSKGQ